MIKNFFCYRRDFSTGSCRKSNFAFLTCFQWVKIFENFSGSQFQSSQKNLKDVHSYDTIPTFAYIEV